MTTTKERTPRVMAKALILMAGLIAAACSSNPDVEPQVAAVPEGDEASAASSMTSEPVASTSVPATLETPEDLPVEWVQLDCVYDGSIAACAALERAGFGPDDNYGLGNSLAQTPSTFLRADCNSLGTSTAAGAFACAELATRDVSPGGSTAAADASFDCVMLPSIPDTCIFVIYRGDGDAYLEEPETLPIDWAQLDCVYGNSADACFVLELAKFGADDNYGLGNSLTQTPIDFLQDTCSSFGLRTGVGSLACAELATRD